MESVKIPGCKMKDGGDREYRQRVEDGFSTGGQIALQRKEMILIIAKSLNLFKH